jgi:superfamily II DNA/RNA helicase
LTNVYYKYEGFAQIELPSFERLISDCAKLKKLDELLRDLKKNDHRVLIFCQMTRMIDIIEEYMAKRRYTYFRMDGSTNIADRRDMVNEFQTNRKIFAFLLSTRAGGLGVNLTGADTVIFYDNDWNPTMDAQATDRAHRIGQTRPVSVFRLTTKDTIEERILKRAKQKQNVQTTVYAGGAFKADIFKQSEIVELLYSEEEVKKLEAERKKVADGNVLQTTSIENLANINPSASAVEDIKMSISKQIGGKNKKFKGPDKGKEKNKKSNNGKSITKKEEDLKINSSEINTGKDSLPRNIFSVSTGTSKRNIFNTLKCDS